MRFVEHATIRPQHCAVFPSLGARHSKGYIDTHVDLDRERVYISVEAVEQLATLQGWHPPERQAAYDDMLAAKDAEIADLRERLVEADRFAEAAKYTLGKFGQTVQRKPGPRPKAVA